jgi:hypothetical protein
MMAGAPRTPACPNCRAPMTSHAEEAHGAVVRTIDVGCCAACSLLWFDDSGSIRLTPRAVLALFQYIGQAGAARNTLAASMSCPRCDRPLAFTHDLQRTTRFTYWRCTRDHGQLMTFQNFLAEKNFIRAPSAQELLKLRQTVRQINCSQCGAPIDLARESACAHCGAPIALIDADGVAKALRELSAASGSPPGAQVTGSSALDDAQIGALFDLERLRQPHGRDDLLVIGASAIAEVIASWVSSGG